MLKGRLSYCNRSKIFGRFFITIVAVVSLFYLPFFTLFQIAQAATHTWTSQADWESGTRSNVDTTTTAGSLKLSSSGGGATIAFRGAASMGINSSPTAGAPTVSKPSGVVDNDVMIASVSYYSNSAQNNSVPTVTPPAGWTLLRRTTNTGNGFIGLIIYYKVASSEGSSYTWGVSGGGSSLLIGISAYSGVDTSSPIDVENGQSVTAVGSSYSTPSITTTVTNARIVTNFTIGEGPDVWSTPSGETQRFFTSHIPPVDNGAAAALNDENQAVAGATGTKTATNVSGGNAVTHILALKPSSSSTFNTPGTDTIQKDSGSSGTTWSALSWNGTTPTNTAIKARARAAESQGGLASASWSSYVTTSGGSISLTGRWAEVEWHLSTTDTAASPTLSDGTITYTTAGGGGESGGGGGGTGGTGGGGSGGTGGTGGGGGTTGGGTSPTPTPVVTIVPSCSAAIKNLTVTASHVQSDVSFTTTTNTKGTIFYGLSSFTNPKDDETKKATNYITGTTKVEEPAAVKDHKLSLTNLTPSTKYYYTLVLSNGTQECEHKFTTQAPPATPTPTPTPKATGKPAPVMSGVSGFVYEQGTTNPVPNVSIYLQKRWLFGWRFVGSVLSDANGQWQIKYEKGLDYRVGNSLTFGIGVPGSISAGLDFAKAGESCPASETNARFIGWYKDKQLTEKSCENNIFYTSKVAQVSGTVIDPTTNKPAPGVTVALQRKEFFGLLWRNASYATTDVNGKWTFAYLTGHHYRTVVSLQDSSNVFPSIQQKATDTTPLVYRQYRADGRAATPGCTATSQDELAIEWSKDNALTSAGCANNIFYATALAKFSVQVLVDKANAPLPNVPIQIIGKRNGIWTGSQKNQVTNENGLLTFYYFPGTAFRVNLQSRTGYVHGYTNAFPGCRAQTILTRSNVNYIEWDADKTLPKSGCDSVSRFYMTSLENVNLAVQIDPPGGTFANKVNVKLTYTPVNHVATIRWKRSDLATATQNGSAVKDTDGRYTSQIVITKNSRLLAAAIGSRSPDAAADFTITKGAPTPTPSPTPGATPAPNGLTVTASPVGGEFAEPTTVSLAASDSLAKIFYSTDGSDPISGGKEYTAPVTLSASTLLHFYAKKDATESELGEEEYTFKKSENPIIIDWEPIGEGDTPPPYVVTCNSEVLTTTTETSYTDSSLHSDGCAYKIRAGDTDIPPTKISFIDLTESSKSAAIEFAKIATVLAALLAAIPLLQTIARIPELLRYAWVHLFLLFGFRKKGREGGRVESATTEKGIFGAGVAFIDTAHYNRVVERTFSDRNGNFAVTSKPGTYSLQAEHPNYVFPSYVSTKGYHGGELKITESQAAAITVPMDETNGGARWYQWLKAVAFRLASFNTIVLVVGLALTVYSLVWGMPSLTITLMWLNGLLAVYYFIFFIQEMRRWKSGRKTVTVKQNGKVAKLAIVRLTNAAGETVYTRVTDAAGKVFIFVPKGTYTMSITAQSEQGKKSLEQAIRISRNPLAQSLKVNIQ